MDNIIFSTMIGLVAAFMTAILGFTKLINDKEGKTSDFRQAWTVSIRHVLSELVSNFRYLLDLYERVDSAAESCEKLSFEMSEVDYQTNTPKYEVIKEAFLFNKGKLENTLQEIIQTRKDIRKNISLAQMHFKHNDSEFLAIEHKISTIMSILRRLKDDENSNQPKDVIESKLNSAKSEIEILCTEITFTSRSILKCEWERIKKGEDVYQKTKKFFKNSSLVVTAMIVTLFIAIFIAKYSSHIADQKFNAHSVSKKIDVTQSVENTSPKCYSKSSSPQSPDCDSNLPNESENKNLNETIAP